ncbi:NDP-sugar epimerase, includes UDP-GlcNAc-inverting 4,6-dehydratase FlaA1 and capsular polysaccharide biosynthesis protein EpsC [Aristaeella lactis]|uniref:NDP-sugar epimerase, includes UDP-GlcNAc-inverting 4,6-dehydratase FlaA1 and capsular polysaccharide biosynthesis protein EpsC n=2 Tax=Aristaeella lactis TaxID=3046383 RepID=A0AC61PNE6_9FIRM|nr:NDP-sugar epimerase, includes UDP-GlcNAc-inverting 4,6-dehydratase FlaA1 and capsular polysaccharide biosynthesis protein EpsC [Aristaeella lactis]
MLDAVFIFIGLLISLEFYFSLRVPEGHVYHLWRTMPLLLVTTLTALAVSGIYRTILAYAGQDILLQSGISTLAGTGITYLVSLIIYLFRDQIGTNFFLMPRPVYFIQWVITFFLVGASRFLIRYRTAGSRRKEDKETKRILIIGAGYAGSTVIRDIQNGRYGNATAVAILDDDPARQHSSISRVPIVGGTDMVAETAERYNISEIIIAIATPNGDITTLLNDCIGTGAHVMIYSGVREGAEARDVNIADLLGRAEQHLDMTEVHAYLTGKTILITGGGGSIGSELCRQILAFTPKKLILYDISENYMYDLFFELKEKYGELVANTLVLEVGSVRDEESLWRVMGKYKPDVVIHAAAHKHVPLMETSSEQAILNNVFGTYKTAKVAIECGVKRFVMISTDKAVNPTNVMGASKRLAEIIITSIPNKKTEFMAVRFGNVLGSHGSVVPIFERQIRAGGPVTLTDPNIIRYFMTIPEAASLVLQAVSIAKGGEVFILDMGEPVRIKDLAEKMIHLYGTGREKIVCTGLRPGEKLYEELLLDKENDQATERDRIYVAKQDHYDWETVEQMLRELEDTLERHGDIRQCLHKLLPTFREPEKTSP